MPKTLTVICMKEQFADYNILRLLGLEAKIMDPKTTKEKR